jgi:CRP-like cAMP-binding protein
MIELGERERALTVLHGAAEALLGHDHLLAALAACRRALWLNPSERRVLDTVRRIHARGSTRPGEAAPPLPPVSLVDQMPERDVSGLLGEALREGAFEVLAAPDPTAKPAKGSKPQLPLFGELPREAFVELVPRMGLRELQPGMALSEEGDGPDSLLVLVEGRADVLRTMQGKTQALGHLQSGAVLGELALILGAPRGARVLAATVCEVLEVFRDDLNQVAQAHPEVPRVVARFAQQRMARNLLATAPLFVGLPEAQRAELLGRFAPRVLQAGEKALVEGQKAEGLILVLAGELVVTKHSDGGEVTLSTLHEGDVVGEISLLTQMPATATVTAARRTAAAFLDREEVLRMIKEFPGARQYLEALSQRRLLGLSAALWPAEVLDADDLIETG